MPLLHSDLAAFDALRTELLERVASGRIEVPLLPQTASQVLATCNETACDSRHLANLIQRDPALAGHVLSVANSAAYAPREPIVSLAQAISRLGFRVICEIALAVALKGKVFSVQGREARVRTMWSHSACAGAWAKEIARARRKNVEGAFLCGLLHDVGQPAVLQASLELFSKHHRELDEEVLDAWTQEFHAQVGALMLERWNFPQWMGAAVRFHHDPYSAGEHVEHALTAQMADLLAHASTHPDPMADAALAQHPALADLDIYTDEFQALLERREKVLELAKAFQ
ncbi:MAG: HDOD domain-containing protein [Planctomycetota bacterium]